MEKHINDSGLGLILFRTDATIVGVQSILGLLLAVMGVHKVDPIMALKYE